LTGALYPLACSFRAPKRNAQKYSESSFMKFSIVIFAIASLASPLVAQEKPPQLKDTKDKASYAIGLNIGFNFKKQNVDLNTDALLAGVKDALSGKKPLLSETEVRDTMTAFSKEIADKQKVASEKNAADGEKFLAENKKKDGVKTTPSGLQFKVLKDGAGAMPGANDTVTVNYRGTLIDGTEFDSSYKRGEAATFPVQGVIKGWTEALQLMKKGAKYQLFIPASLAYGERAMGPDIAPNSTLIFEVELMDIKPGAAAASPSPAATEPAKPKS
jgi:FKBP-type peptidyl-prolyl cis-trans isomerase FklB